MAPLKLRLVVNRLCKTCGSIVGSVYRINFERKCSTRVALVEHFERILAQNVLA